MDTSDTGSDARAEPGAEPPHGGRLIAARARFPHAPPFIDLSTGINPVPYPLPRLPDAAFTRLPEPEEETALRWEAAAAYGAPHESMVAASPGTSALIAMIPRLFPCRRAAVLEPTYAEHARAWREAGREAGAGLEPVRSLDEAMAAVADGRVGAVALCNPNNPDGARHPPEALLALADALHRQGGQDGQGGQDEQGGLLVVDETCADLEPDARSLAPRLPHPAVVVLRSVGKAYGLGGLRLGFAIAAPERAARIRAGLGPWPVSGAAIAIGRQLLADRAWRARAAARLRQDAGLLDQMLTGAGLRVVGGTRLFRLGEGADAPALYERLGAAGILVRRFPERPDWLRLGIPGPERDWRRLGAALDADPFSGAFTRRTLAAHG